MDQTKQLLSYLRQGDFAHPGEIEAIQLAMKPIAKNKSQRLLDVGCGLGGTAHYLHEQGWGEIVGIDIDSELIDYAKTHYSQVSFIHADILQREDSLPGPFDVIYCFTSFFCFGSQENALRQFSSLAKKNCDLIIFDYSRPDASSTLSPFPWSKTASRFHPIYLPELKEQLLKTGWHFKTSLDLSNKFEHWYTELLHQFDKKRDSIILQFNETLFNKMYEGYQQLLTAIKEKKLGGIIVYANR